MSANRVPLSRALELTGAFFERHGCTPASGASVARALVGAEADGLKGHGLSRLGTYAAMLDRGKIDGQATPTLHRAAPGVVAVDAANGFAYPAIDLAIDQLRALAPQQGIACASIVRSGHCGAAGLHVERLAEHNLVALMFANTPAGMAPWGGQVPVFGTNPIAFAAPRGGSAPIVVDMSVSKVARGNLLAAKQRGESIPEGWALDPDGKPTTDPERGLAGTMLPMGDAKGSALALVVEVLAACLVGAHLSGEASSFLDADGPPPETGQFLIAIAPGAFGHGRFGERMATLAAAIEGQSGARLPGARRIALREKAAREGIEVPALLLTGG